MSGRAMGTSDFSDLINCMICFDAFSNPKMLKCGHTFCSSCLEGYLNTYQQQRRAVPGKLPCPTCRDFTTLPQNGVKGLRNDFKVKKIEEMFKTVNLKEIRARNAYNSCEACKAQKIATQGRYYCMKCTMVYCADCKQKHDRNPLFKDHNMLDKEKNDGESVGCKVHLSERARFFCKQCETVVCTLCVMHEHENHDITEVSKVFQEQHEDIKNLQNNLAQRLANLKTKNAEIERIRQLNLQSVQEAELTIKEQTVHLIDLLKKKEVEMLAELRAKRDTKLRQLAKAKDSVAFHLAKSSSLKDYAVTTINRPSLRRLALHEELIQRMRTASDQDVGPGDDWRAVITFLPGRQDVSIGRLDEVRGSVDQLSRQVNNQDGGPSQRRRPSPSVQGLMASSFSKPQLLFKINKCGNKRGETRDPLGVACLLNGDIAVSEWGNKRIQVFDSVGKHICTIGEGKVGPQGIAVTLKGNIMITDANHKRLEVFALSGESLAKWGFGKFYVPCAIAVCPNGNFVISDLAEHTVSIYRGEHKCIRRMGGKGSGDEQFSNPLYVAAGHHSEVLVSDSDNHCIKVFDNAGRFVRKFGKQGKEEGCFNFPRGVCINEDGNILVADRNNDRICMFTPEGHFIRTVLSKEDGIKEPYGLAMTVTRNLIVTESSVDRAAIKMFQM